MQGVACSAKKAARLSQMCHKKSLLIVRCNGACARGEAALERLSDSFDRHKGRNILTGQAVGFKSDLDQPSGRWVHQIGQSIHLFSQSDQFRTHPFDQIGQSIHLFSQSDQFRTHSFDQIGQSVHLFSQSDPQISETDECGSETVAAGREREP